MDIVRGGKAGGGRPPAYFPRKNSAAIVKEVEHEVEERMEEAASVEPGDTDMPRPSGRGAADEEGVSAERERPFDIGVEKKTFRGRSPADGEHHGRGEEEGGVGVRSPRWPSRAECDPHATVLPSHSCRDGGYEAGGEEEEEKKKEEELRRVFRERCESALPSGRRVMARGEGTTGPSTRVGFG